MRSPWDILEEQEEFDDQPIDSEKAWKILRDGGMDVTLEESAVILSFLRKLAEITLPQILTDEKANRRPLCKGKYR
jgi:hypothetical protein